MKLWSDSWPNGESIPARYAAGRLDGAGVGFSDNLNPHLAWSEVPAGTQSFALIMEDPDAPMGTWTHWVLSNIPVERRGLEEDIPVTGKNIASTNGIFVGTNSAGKIGYDGPCPPSGTHRYYFRLYALDIQIGLLPGATKEDVLREI